MSAVACTRPRFRLYATRRARTAPAPRHTHRIPYSTQTAPAHQDTHTDRPVTHGRHTQMGTRHDAVDLATWAGCEPSPARTSPVSTSIHSKLSLSAMLLKSQSSIFLKQRRRRFCLFLLSRRATALHYEARPTSFSYAAHTNTSTGDEQPTRCATRRHVLKDFGLQTTGPPHRDHAR